MTSTGPSAITTHVIGFALDETEQANLQCIVDESGGLLLGAGDADELSKALFTVLEELEVVVKNGFIEIESIGGVFPTGAPVFAVTRSVDDLTLFISGNNGVVYTSSWSPAEGWSGVGNRWTPIGGVFPPGASVTVVSRAPDRLDAFVTGNNGVVYTSAWQEGGTWSGVGNRWWSIGGIFPRAAPVCVVARGRDRLDLFITGNNGIVYTSSWTPGQGWSGVGNRWTPLGEC